MGGRLWRRGEFVAASCVPCGHRLCSAVIMVKVQKILMGVCAPLRQAYIIAASSPALRGLAGVAAYAPGTGNMAGVASSRSK